MHQMINIFDNVQKCVKTNSQPIYNKYFVRKYFNSEVK